MWFQNIPSSAKVWDLHKVCAAPLNGFTTEFLKIQSNRTQTNLFSRWVWVQEQFMLSLVVGNNDLSYSVLNKEHSNPVYNSYIRVAWVLCFSLLIFMSWGSGMDLLSSFKGCLTCRFSVFELLLCWSFDRLKLCIKKHRGRERAISWKTLTVVQCFISPVDDFSVVKS